MAKTRRNRNTRRNRRRTRGGMKWPSYNDFRDWTRKKRSFSFPSWRNASFRMPWSTRPKDGEIIRTTTSNLDTFRYDEGSHPYFVAIDKTNWTKVDCDEYTKYIESNRKHKEEIDHKEKKIAADKEKLSEEIRSLQTQIASKQSWFTKVGNHVQKMQDKQKYEANRVSLTAELIPALNTKSAELQLLNEYTKSDSLKLEKKANESTEHILFKKQKYCLQKDESIKKLFDHALLNQEINTLIRTHDNITRKGNSSAILGSKK
jgi:hypothetical protein